MATINVRGDALFYTAPPGVTSSYLQYSTSGSVTASYSAQWQGTGLGYTPGTIFPTSGTLTLVSASKNNGEFLYSASGFSLNLATIPLGKGIDEIIYLYIAPLAKNNIYGSEIDDLLLATEGDYVYGGLGTDTLILTQTSSTYEVSNINTLYSSATITNKNNGWSVSVSSVEKLAFNDKVLLLSSYLAPTYSLASTSSTINEGQTAVFNLATTNVQPNTVIAYTISGVSAADVSSGTLTGNLTIGSDGRATLSIPIRADSSTEGDETLVVTIQGQSSSIVIRDTSQSSVPTYSVSSSATSVSEGASSVFTLTTTNIAAGTIVPYTLSGVSKDDVVGGSLTGNVTIGSNGQGTVTVQLTSDKTTEGNETLTFTAQGKSVSVVVNDTSTFPKLSAILKAATGDLVEIGKQAPILQGYDPDWTKMTAGSLEQFNINGRGNGDNVIRAINVMTILDDPADGRQIDPTRLGFWIEQIEEGTLTLGDKVMRDILSGFVYGKDFSDLALKRMDTNGDGINDISYTKAAVQVMYRNVLGRSWTDIVNDGGLNYLVSEIEANRLTIVEVAERVCLGAEAINSAVGIVGAQNLTFVAFGDGFGG